MISAHGSAQTCGKDEKVCPACAGMMINTMMKEVLA